MGSEMCIRDRTTEQAIEILNDVLSALHLTNDYTSLMKIEENLQSEMVRFRNITTAYENSKKTVQDMLDARLSLNFLYRDIVDRFSYDINSKKIYFEELKTIQRADSMRNLKNNKEIVEEFNLNSTSSLRDSLGMDDDYKSYVSNVSISYGLYQELQSFLNSIRQFIDYLASAIKQEQLILTQDAK